MLQLREGDLNLLDKILRCSILSVGDHKSLHLAKVSQKELAFQGHKTGKKKGIT